MIKYLSIACVAFIISGCTDAAVKTPVADNQKNITSAAGASISPPLPQMGVTAELPSKLTVPTNAIVGIQNTNWPLYSLSWSASPSANVSYQVWSTASLTKPFALLATTTNLSWPVEATNAAGYFKVRSVNQAGLTSKWAT